MTRDEALQGLQEAKAIAVIRLAEAETLFRVVEALRAGGVRAVEITMTTPGALAAIRELAATKPPGSLVGVGTVLDADAARAVISAGADFVVSPVTEQGVVRACRDAGVLIAPGALTPTEVLRAWNMGADIVKLFPATSLGPGYLKDLKGPLPQVRLMPTGGVTPANARAFLEAGACCVALGTSLVDKAAVRAGNWARLTALARELIESLSSRVH